MKAAPFLEAYPHSIAERHFNLPEQDATMVESRQWSNRFGEVLYDCLSGTPPDGDQLSDMLGSYRSWQKTGLVAAARAMDQRDDPHALEHTNELNFHYLNAAMLPAWAMLAADRSNGSVQGRRQMIEMSQDAIALAGLNYYVSREAAASQNANYVYFDADNARRREHFEGRANEFDSGMVLLELMKRRKDLIVVPAPGQFEKFNRPSEATGGKSARVDFVFLEKEEVGGVQVKGFVTNETADKYDLSRMILLDTANDLGNKRYVRTQTKSSAKKLVSWGGLLCAQHVAAMKLHHNPTMHFVDRRSLMPTIGKAKFLTAGIKSYRGLATDRIGERLTAFVSHEAAPQSEAV